MKWFDWILGVFLCVIMILDVRLYVVEFVFAMFFSVKMFVDLCSIFWLCVLNFVDVFIVWCLKYFLFVKFCI